jgi:hypothetical protein
MHWPSRVTLRKRIVYATHDRISLLLHATGGATMCSIFKDPWLPAWLQAIGAIAGIFATVVIARTSRRSEQTERRDRAIELGETLALAASMILNVSCDKLRHAIGLIKHGESVEVACRRCAHRLADLHNQLLSLPTKDFENQNQIAALVKARVDLSEAVRFCSEKAEHGTAGDPDDDNQPMITTLGHHADALAEASKAISPRK